MYQKLLVVKKKLLNRLINRVEEVDRVFLILKGIRKKKK